MKIQLLGGSGFIGTNLISELIMNHQVTNLDRNDSSKYQSLTQKCDITDKEQLNEQLNYSDWLVLLAAEHRDDVWPREKYYDVNVEGTKNVLKAMAAKGINKIIFTSSIAIFGLDKENPNEEHSQDPFNDYGISKWQAEEVLRAWYNERPQERTLIIIRPTVVFGVGNKGNVYNLLKQIASGKFLMIGDGMNRKSMAYVKNVSAFIQHCIQKNLTGYQLFNYVDKPDLTMNELVSTAEESLNKKLLPIRIPYALGLFAGKLFDILAIITRKKLPISTIRIKKFCATTQFSSKRVAETGFIAPHKLADALQVTIKSIANETT